MQLTRRNTIIGLGTIAAGAGVIGGSGAFDSVEADRSFEVSVSGDANALLGLQAADNSIIAGTETGGAGGNDIIYFELQDEETEGQNTALNENATTEFFDTFSVTNNGNQTVTLTIELGDIKGVSFLLNAEPDSTEPEKDLSSEGHTLNPGDSIDIDLRIDTTEGGYKEPGENDVYQITIRAQTAAAGQA